MSNGKAIGTVAAKRDDPLQRSYASSTADTALLGMTIGAAFDNTVKRFPDREALVVRSQGLRDTWAHRRAEVDRCARGLLSLGVQKGDRVGIWAPNRSEWTANAIDRAGGSKTW
jgi:fatty-acyl-CoA synthase